MEEANPADDIHQRGLDKMDELDVESDVQTDIPIPGPLETNVVHYILAINVITLVLTFGVCSFRKTLVFGQSEVSKMMRSFVRKMAVFNILCVLGLGGIYYYVYLPRNVSTSETHGVEPVDKGQEEPPAKEGDDAKQQHAGGLECFGVIEHRFLIVCVVIATGLVGFIRYLTLGFAYSEAFSKQGDFILNTGTHSSCILPGFDASKSATFKKPVGPCCLMSLLLIPIALVVLYAPIPTAYTDSFLQAPVCMAGWPEVDTVVDWNKLGILFLLGFLPCPLTLTVQNIHHVFGKGLFTSKLPGYFLILNAPYVVMNLSTTWAFWMFLMLAMTLSGTLAGGAYYIAVIMFYILLDSSMNLYLCLVVGRRNRHNYLTS